MMGFSAKKCALMSAVAPNKVLSKVLGASVLVIGLIGCGEKSQDLTKGVAGSTVTRDTRAYEGEASKYALTSFKRGDKTAWETHMKTRMQGQDEYSREK